MNFRIKQNHRSHAECGNDGSFRIFVSLLLVLLLLPISLPLQAKKGLENNAAELLNQREESKQLTWQVTNDAPFRVTAASPLLKDNGETLKELGFNNIDELLDNVEGKTSYRSVAFSPDGRFIASGSIDNTLKLWDIKNRILTHTFKGHSKAVLSISFSTDGRFIASGSTDKSIKLWDIHSKTLVHTFDGHSGRIYSVNFSPNGQFIVSGSADKSIKLWDIENRTLAHTFDGHSSAVKSVVFSPNGQVIASGLANKSIKLWDIQSQKLIHTFEEPSLGGISSVSFSPDGRFIASSSTNKSIKLWDIKNRTLVHTFKGHLGAINSVDFSPDGRFIVSGSGDKTIKLWDIKNQMFVRSFEGHSGSVNSVAFSPDGRFIISGSEDKSIKLWGIQSQIILHTFEGYSNIGKTFAFSSDERFASSSSSDKSIKLWDVQNQILAHTFEGHSNIVEILTFSPDGRFLVSGSKDKTIKLWDIKHKTLIHTFEGHSGGVYSVNFSPNGRFIISGSGDKTIKLWDIKKQILVHTFEGHSSEVYSVGFSPDGQSIVSGSADKSIKLWGIENQMLIHTFKGHSSIVNTVYFSLDGRSIISSSRDRTVKRWDIQSQTLIQTYGKFSGSVKLAPTNSNGLIKLPGFMDNFIKLGNKKDKSHKIILVSSIVNSWLLINKNNQVFRSEHGGFLRHQTENNDWLPVLPTELSLESNFSISINPDSFSVSAEQGKDKPITINITNNGPEAIYWLKLKPTQSEDGVIRLIEPDNQLKPKGKSIWKPFHINKLEAGETATLHARISTNLKLPADFIQSGIRPLAITVVSANGTEVSQTIEVDVKLPKLEWTKATLEPNGSSLKVKLQNTGAADFHEGYVQLLTEGLDQDSTGKYFTAKQTIPNLKPGESIELAFILPKQANLLYLFKTLWKPELLQLRGQSNQLPIFAWNLTTQRISWLVFWLLAVVVGLFVLAFVYLRLYRHPLLVELSNHPEKLQQIPPEQLLEARRRLKKSNRLESVLVKGKVSAITLGKGIDFINSDTNEQKIQYLADRLGTHSTYIQLNLWQLQLPENFPLNLQHCLVYFPAKKTAAIDVFNDLKGCAEVNRTATLLIGHDSEYQRKLYATSKDLSNKWVAPSGRDLTQLLLSPEPEKALADIFAGQLALTLLSPYQLGGGVNNKSVFFGRMEIIDHVLNREPANYLIAGGRQLGKSSLLKALDRRFKEQGSVTCFYLALSSEVLIPRLLLQIGLPKEAGIEGLADYARQSKRQLVFLIDEADKFIRQEREQDYHILNTLRQMSEEGHCYFILAGFWELYQHAVLDYQSPLKNFAETIQIGALEDKACLQLATLPMKTLRVEYDNPVLVEQLLESTGGRANLIAIVCHQMIEKLKPNQRVITEQDVNEALQSEKTLNALRGWGAMTDDEQVCRLDRIIVYATIDHNQFTFEQLVKILINQNINPSLQLIEHSLARLKLGFVLGNELKNQYRYQVPLFREMILNESPVTKLNIEIDEWNSGV